MSGLITAVTIFVIVVVIVKKYKEQSTAGSGKKQTKAAGKAFTNYRPHKDIISVNREMDDKRGSSTLHDDKTNDWLARQLRDEHKAFRMTSEMFDLKIEHASHCDARLLAQFQGKYRNFHGVDTGTGKTLRK